MKSETIVFNGIRFRRYPESERRTHRVYYSPGISDRQKGIQALHQEIWKAANGPIPEGFHVHHRDHDPLNNNLSNLECIPARDHHQHHSADDDVQERLTSPEWLEHLAVIREQTKTWHASPGGLEWHRQNGIKSMAKRPVLAGTCEQCGNAFLSKKPDRFCSNKCKAAWRRASGVDNETRTCNLCGNAFEVNKYAQKNYCSRSCASKAGRAHTATP